MADGAQRVGVDEVRWSGVLAWTRLFRTFGMALAPSRLLLALLFVILCFLGGKVLDFMWGPAVYSGELTQYAAQDHKTFDAWRLHSGSQISDVLARHLRGRGISSEDIDKATQGKGRFARTMAMINQDLDHQVQQLQKMRKQVEEDLKKQQQEIATQVKTKQITAEVAAIRNKRLDDNLQYTAQAQTQQNEQLQKMRLKEMSQVQQLQPRGIFEASSQFVLGAFDRGVLGAASLNFGLGDLLRANPRDSASVAGALRDVFFTLPSWLYHTHFWFMLVYGLIGLVLWSLIGGAITRMAALDATQGNQGSTAEALEFSARRFVWFFFTPLFPFIGCVLLSLVLMLGGLVFFNAHEVWILDIAGGLFFGVAVIIGLILAVIVILTAGGGHLFYPALAAEGTDAFDALSRSFGYLIARPWRWLFYTLVSMVYFAVSYLFVGLVLFMSLSITQGVVRLAVFRQTGSGDMNRFDAMFPAPQLGHLVYNVQWSLLDTPGKIASALIWVWVFLTVTLLAAFAISFYANVQVWIYLLLRKSVDGTDYDEVFISQPALIALDIPAVDAGQTADKIEASPEISPEAPSATGDDQSKPDAPESK